MRPLCEHQKFSIEQKQTRSLEFSKHVQQQPLVKGKVGRHEQEERTDLRHVSEYVHWESVSLTEVWQSGNLSIVYIRSS
jgi:hypothetical protein